MILYILAAALASAPAFAGWTCVNPAARAKLEISADQKFVRAEAAAVSEYYRGLPLQITSLESVVDPETGSPVYERHGEETIYMVYAPNSGTEWVWSLGLKLSADAKNAAMEIIDQEGKIFSFTLDCTVH